jgi:hypothetical protein
VGLLWEQLAQRGVTSWEDSVGACRGTLALVECFCSTVVLSVWSDLHECAFGTGSNSYGRFIRVE